MATLLTLALIPLLLSPTNHPWLLPSHGGSCVIIFAMPTSEMARMRNVLGGHAITATVGVVFLRAGWTLFGGPRELWMVSAVAIALVLMMATRTIHSPAGGNPIIMFYEDAHWTFLLYPLTIGLAILAASALIFRRLGDERVPWTCTAPN
jgi:CBS-domain-containing membrane protein